MQTHVARCTTEWWSVSCLKQAFSSDVATDELVQQEKEMLQEDEKREFQVLQVSEVLTRC